MIESVKEMTDRYNEARLEGEPIMTVEEMGALVGYADMWCSWCGKYLSTNPSITGKTSHGICQVCSDNMILEMALEEFKKTPKSEFNVHRIQAFLNMDYNHYNKTTIMKVAQAHELMRVGRKRKLTERITPNV